MTLDPVTMQAVTGIVILTVTVLFLVDARSRGDSPVDRLWALAFGGAILGALAYVVAAAVPALWWANAVGNSGTALTTFAMWSGARVWAGRSSLVRVSLAAAALCSIPTLAAGPDGGAWAGAWAMLLGTATGALLAGGELLRPRPRRLTAAALLGTILIAVGAFYLARLAVLLTAGPGSATFRTWTGTTSSSLVIIVLITSAAFLMVAMRGEDARRLRAERNNYDPMTGARTVSSFRPRALELLAADRAAHRPVAMLTVRLDEHERIATAFGRERADDAVVLLGEVLTRLSPPRSLLGREDHRISFDVLLSRAAREQARAWAEQVRAEVVATALPVGGAQVRLRVSIGVAGDDTVGYDLDDLAQVSRDLATAAHAGGGNRVRLATAEEAAASLVSVGRRHSPDDDAARLT